MAIAAPNVAEFIAAQNELRARLGAQVIFKIPIGATWPEGTKINPENGLPYDPTVKRTDATFEEVTKTALIIQKQGSPLRPQADTRTEPIGEMSGMGIILDVAAADHAAIENATEMTINGSDYRVSEMTPFSIATTIYRYLVYGMQR